MKKTISNNLKDLNCTGNELIEYLIWLYEKSKKHDFFNDSNYITANKEICLDKFSSKVCWLYLAGNKSLRYLLNRYNNPSKLNDGEAISSDLYFKYGISNPDNAFGYDYKDFIRRPKAITAITGERIKEHRHLLDILYQQSLIVESNSLFIRVNTDYSADLILGEVKAALTDYMDDLKRDDIGKKTFTTDMIFRHIISHYFVNDEDDKRDLSSDDKVNDVLTVVLGRDNPVSGKQISKDRKNFMRISKLAPFVFFK